MEDKIRKIINGIKDKTTKVVKKMKDGMPRIITWTGKHKDLTFWLGLTVILSFSIGGLIHVFSNHGSQPAPGTGWFFLKLLLLGLIGGAIASREKPYLSLTLVGMAGLVFLVLLGKFNSLFSWNVLGLPFFAAASIYGVTKTEGRTRSFLGFSSGIIILYWMYLFYQVHPIKDTGFIGRQFFANDTVKSIFLIFLAVFLFAVWKRSKTFYLISFLVLLSFLGNGMVNEIIDRFPKKLTPAVSSKYKKTWEKVRDASLERISEAVAVEKKDKKEKKISQKISQKTELKLGKLLMTVVSTHDPVFADALPKPLGHGKYYQVPAGRTAYQFLGESRPRFIGDGRSFSVPKGKIVVGAKTDHKFINIYQRE